MSTKDAWIIVAVQVSRVVTMVIPPLILFVAGVLAGQESMSTHRNAWRLWFFVALAAWPLMLFLNGL